ncbi:P-loop containing nucleoside triphosphate hydrolase [Rhypophila sp. PSN 637]
MEDSSDSVDSLPTYGNLSWDDSDTQEVFKLLVTSTISTDENEKTGFLVLLAVRVSRVLDEYDDSENTASRQLPPGRVHRPDPVIIALAARAETDEDLRQIMKRVSLGLGSRDDLITFQRLIDEISAGLKSESEGIETNTFPETKASKRADTTVAQVLDQPQGVPIASNLSDKNTETLPKVAVMLLNAMSNLISENTRPKEQLRATERAMPIQVQTGKLPGAKVDGERNCSDSDTGGEVVEEEYKSSLGELEGGTVRSVPAQAGAYDADEKRGSPTFCFLHKVICRNGGQTHFLDPPRVFRGDRKLDHVRGQMGIDLGTYFDQHCEEVFAVVDIYKCACGQGPTDHQVVGFSDGRLVQDLSTATCTGQAVFLRDSLRDTIKDLITLHPARFEGFSSRQTDAWCHKPYYPFYLHNQTFLDLVHSNDLEQERSAQLGLLCEWFKDHLRQDWEEADEMFSRGKVNLKHCTKLFRPSELVFHPRENDPGLGKVFKTDDYPWRYTDVKYVDISEWEFNGSFYKTKLWIDVTSKLTQWEPESDITSLPYYPLRFADPDLQRKLIARGHKFWSCRKQKLVTFMQETEANAGFEHIGEDRIMVDYNIFKSLHSTKAIFRNKADDIGKTAMDKDEPPDDDFLAIMPPKIHAFNFTMKSWRLIRVDRITGVTWNKDAFKRLVVPPETRELIGAAVTVHGHYLTTARDIIDGKGRGLLILLHGGPGTGKTLTASVSPKRRSGLCIASPVATLAWIRKMLKRQHLQLVLTIGKAWSCDTAVVRSVVLLDEADVFLEERSLNDQRQNVFVSIFLRALEYYDGILILTTNRVGTFDEAFKSRIHLALLYPNLDEEQRAEIWRNFIRMLSRTKELVHIEDLERNVYKLAQIDINGRQIRNILTLARYLAKFHKQVLVYNHVRDAVASVMRFDKYLKTVRGSDDRLGEGIET